MSTVLQLLLLLLLQLLPGPVGGDVAPVGGDGVVGGGGADTIVSILHFILPEHLEPGVYVLLEKTFGTLKTYQLRVKSFNRTIWLNYCI